MIEVTLHIHHLVAIGCLLSAVILTVLLAYMEQ